MEIQQRHRAPETERNQRRQVELSIHNVAKCAKIVSSNILGLGRSLIFGIEFNVSCKKRYKIIGFVKKNKKSVVIESE